MALKDIFKKKDKEQKDVNKDNNVVVEKDKELKNEKKDRKSTVSDRVFVAPFVMKEPHITEKASDLTNYNQYVFKVYKNANKTEIKKAVEQVYKVNVVDVKIINVKEKKRRLGRFEGVKPGFKKAIVKLKEGQKIEIFPR
jgi:large subunit ribosomal protein L23